MYKTSESRINNTHFQQTQEISRANGELTVGTGADRRTDEIENVSALPTAEFLCDRNAELVFTNDLFIHVLYHSDRETLLNLRRVLKSIYQLSMKSISGLSPLMCNVVISFKVAEIIEQSKKLEFALKYTNISISSLDISHLNNPTLLCASIDVKQFNVSLAFKIKNDDELKQLNALISSDTLSNEQKLILNNIKELVLAIVVHNNNIDDVETLLSFFATQERSSQLTSLSFEKIDDALTLPELPSLTSLDLGYTTAALTLPELPSLKSLEFGSINAALTLSKLPSLTSLEFRHVDDQSLNETNALLSFFATQESDSELTSLSFGHIDHIKAALTLPKLPSLLSLSFGDIDEAALKLTELPSLTSLACGRVYSQNVNEINTLLSFFAEQSASQLTLLKIGDIHVALTLTELPNLRWLKIGHIHAALTLTELPNLRWLKFEYIHAALTLTELPNLRWLKFGSIHAALTLSKLPSLTSLKFWNIDAALTLPELPSLMWLEFWSIKAALTLSKLPSLTSLKFSNIDAALTLPELPSLMWLEFWSIKAALTLPQEFPSLPEVFPSLSEVTLKNLETYLTVSKNLVMNPVDKIEVWKNVQELSVSSKADKDLAVLSDNINQGTFLSYAKYPVIMAFFGILYMYFRKR